MSPDIRETLQGAARSPGQPIDPDDLRRRGGRRRTGQVLGGTAMALVVAVAGITALANDRAIDGPPVIAPAPSEQAPSPPAPSSSPGPTNEGRQGVSAVDLGRSVATRPANQTVAVVRQPDGTARELRVGFSEVGISRWHPDESGGIWWQEVCSDPTTSCAPTTSDAIHHTSADGNSREVIPATETFSFPQTWELVGPGLATRRTGSNPDDMNVDLLAVNLDAQTEVVRESVAGWESGIGEAVERETLLWSGGGEGARWATHSPPDGPRLNVYEGGESNGEEVGGVAYLDNGIGVVLVTARAAFPDWPMGRLLLIDHDGSVRDEIEVPFDWADATWNTPSGISASGNHVLVNRYAEGTWLKAIVVDLDTGLWEMYAEPGVSRFAATPAGDDPAVTSTCGTEDTDLRQAPPIDGALWLYWPCDGDADEPWVLYRAEEFRLPDGDPISAMRKHLEAMITGPSAPAADRGFVGPRGLEVSVNAVDGTDHGVTVDFSAPNGFGGYSTSHGSAVWHTMLASVLFQYQQVNEVTLTLDGSCESYSFAFEGDGECVTLTPDDATWNR